MLSINASATLPGLGLDRAARARPTGEPTAAAADGDAPAEIVEFPRARGTGPVEPSGQAQETGTGFGDGARGNLLQSNAKADEAGPDGLTKAEEQQVRELRARDTEVRRHEEAHARVGGQYAGQPSYTYQVGPDGKQYAIGGEVPIDVAPVPDDPEATIRKMEVVIAAALAPAEPSGQDRKVAALASRQRIEATVELAAERRDAQQGGDTAGDEASVIGPSSGSSNGPAGTASTGPSIAGTAKAVEAAGRVPEFERAA